MLGICGPLHGAPMLGNFAFSISQFDFSQFTNHQFYVDQIAGEYLGQPDSVWLGPNVDAGETIIAAYPEGHGGPNTILKKSTDGGITWGNRLPTPADFNDGPGENITAPTIHRFTDPNTGDDRLVIFRTDRGQQMLYSVSEDDGDTWTDFLPQYPGFIPGTSNSGQRGGSPPKEFIQLSDGRTMTTWYTGAVSNPIGDNNGLWYAFTDDGLNWTTPVRYDAPRPAAYTDVLPNEPSFVLSPDGTQIASLIRTGSGAFESFYQISSDDGANWTAMAELPASLTGERHSVTYAPDGRLLISFRDDRRGNNNNASQGDYVLWVGTFDDIINGTEGQYRVRLLDDVGAGSGNDTGYAGLEVMPDGTIVATTYSDQNPGNGSDPDIISVRFTMAELDALANDILGDLTADGDVNVDDWQIFKDNFRDDTSGLSSLEQEDLGDLNTDDIIDASDFIIFRDQFDLFNGAGALGTVVPEPSTAALVAVTSMLLLGKKREKRVGISLFEVA